MRESTLTEDRGSTRRPATCAQLYLALECGNPLARSSRHALVEVDEALLGRGERRGAVRTGRTLRLSIPDRWMSGAHARLLKVLGRWVIEDAGSKNGLRVNGEPVPRATLEDADVIEVGHSFLVFREAEARGPLDLDASELPGASLRTLLPGFAAQLGQLAAVAGSAVPVVIGGESGTGKELAARAVHSLSKRSGAFIAVNCGALPPHLVESELFGHVKGSFSGADQDRPGLIRSADRGTLFLDEIADLPLAAQPALLRVLQEKEVTAVGATRPVKVDLRVACASHADLEQLAAEKKFRSDLLARLSGFTLALPPLRERRGELGLLVGDLLERQAKERAAHVRFSVEAGRALMLHSWPLNVRELEHALDAALAVAKEGELELGHLPPSIRAPKADGRAAPVTEEADAQREELISLLEAHAGNVSAVARAMGKARMQVQRWLKRYGIDARSYAR